MPNRRLVCSALAALTLATSLAAQQPSQQTPRVTSPKQEFGHNFGDDYFLANYKQIEAYWRKLDRESDRMVVQSIGKTAEGREHLMAIVTSPANHRALARYKDVSQRLAKAQLSDADARALAKTGKAVVWIDGGLHATETLGAQQLGEMVYQMVSRTDDETMRILDDVIILFVHANPDGNDLVADWYMRRADTLRRSIAGVPRLYQKYIGHDNNRDFFASTQAETENINRILYHEWFPQILYNHHQSGPAGTIFWSPPLRDPYNYNLDPLIVLGFQALGAAMHQRLAVEGKPGATMRSGGPYDGWWNGGIRNTAAFHNTIALLTEMIGNPTPMRVPLRMERQLPSADMAYPIAPQQWRFRQSVDYSVSLNRAILDYAARNRENVLFNIYAMGARSIARGSADSWTPNPKRYAEFARRFNADSARDRDTTYWEQLRRPEWRDPRAYVISSSQRDFPTATKFVNALRETGITIHRATQPFTAAGKQYPAGSFVVWTAQAFRPHVLDMFEPQVHPDVFPIPGGPPTPPYDNAGWTFAYQMGVEFDRLLEPLPLTANFVEVKDWNLAMPAGLVVGNSSAYSFDRGVNNSYVAANRLLKQGAPVVQSGNTFMTQASSQALTPMARELGVSFNAAAAPSTSPLRSARVGLWDQYGGSMDAGWARWILEQFEFPFTRVFAPELDAGGLDAKYDVLVFVGGAIVGPSERRGPAPTAIPDLPAEFQPHVGRVTQDRTIPQIKAFLEKGGTVVAIGESATGLAESLGLPIENHLVENGAPLPRSKFYLPGSVVRARVDTTNRFAAGMRAQTDFFFDDSPVFKLKPGAEAAGVKAVAWFEPGALRSGWAWGERYLENGVAIVEAKVGNGTALLVGPEILKRAQPHPTFKVLFNAIYESTSSKRPTP